MQSDCFSYVENVDKMLSTEIKKIQTKTQMIMDELNIILPSSDRLKETLQNEVDYYVSISSEIQGLSVVTDQSVSIAGNMPLARSIINSDYFFTQTPLPPYDSSSYLVMFDEDQWKNLYVIKKGTKTIKTVATSTDISKILLPSHLGGFFAVANSKIINLCGNETYTEVSKRLPLGFINDSGFMWINNHYVVYTKNQHTGWYLVFISSREYLEKDLKSAEIYIWALSAFFILVAFLTANFMSGYIVEPLRDLTSQVGAIEGFSGKIQYKEQRFLNDFIGVRWNLKTKIFVVLCIYVVIFSLLFAGLMYSLIRKTVISNAQGSLEILLRQSSNNASQRFKDIEDASWSIAISNETRAILKGSANVDIHADGLTKSILSRNYLYEGIANIKLYSGNGKMLFSTNYSEGHSDTPRINMLGNNPTGWFIDKTMPSSENLLIYLRQIWHGEVETNGVPNPPIGYIEITVFENSLINSYNYPSTIKRISVSNSESYIVSDTNKSLIGYRDQFESGTTLSNGSIILKSSLQFPFDWHLTVFAPYSSLLGESYKVLIYGILYTICALILSLVFAYWFSAKIISRLNKGQEVIRGVRDGYFDERWEVQGKDEIAMLADSFNSMLGRLKQLLVEIYETKSVQRELELKSQKQEKRKKELELDIFQSQINSHFLYNTISSVNFMIMSGKSLDAVKMLNSIGTMFRKVANRGAITVSVSEEIDHAKAYVYIQQQRFCDKFNVVWDIDHSILFLKIMRLILQPCIENSIYHGIESHQEKVCTIKISIHEKDNSIQIVVFDDGIGIEKNDLLNIRKQLETGQSGKNIGLVNISERIHLYFGNHYGLEIDSVFGESTTITIALPIL